MGDFSRDSFRISNVMHELLTGETVPAARHYVGVNMQQGVPILDADWNEEKDIRRRELELVLARSIGNGVPAGSDGFRIRASETQANNNFLIGSGLLFVDGWILHNPSAVEYVGQPHRGHSGLEPALPIPLPTAVLARRELVYADAWEREVDEGEAPDIVDPGIGVEASTRLERAWVVRTVELAAGDDPLAPGSIPDRRPGHRYIPLAWLDRPAGAVIGAGIIHDLRRLRLTLSEATFAPLFEENVLTGQRLESDRLAAAFRGNLEALRDLFNRAPATFLFANADSTWFSMSDYGDVRSLATALEEMARAGLLHRKTALAAMRSFYECQGRFLDRLQGILDGGAASPPTANFLTLYRTHLRGNPAANPPTDPACLGFALDAQDVLGAVLAQERLNQAFVADSDTLPEGTVTASLISIFPTGPVVAGIPYQLTLRVTSNLFSAQGSEPIRAQVSAGAGWGLEFPGSSLVDKREILVTVPNGTTQDIVLNITALNGALDANLNLSVRPERRQQLVFNHPPIPLGLGDEILPGEGAIATLAYQGPPLLPGNIANVPRSAMFGSVSIPFGVTNLSAEAQQYQITVAAQSDATGWQAPNQPILAILAPGANQNVNVIFKTSDQAGAVTPLTYRLQLVRVTGGANEPLPYTRFDITYSLQNA